MNDHYIFGDPLEDAPRFVPCALFEKFGAQKVFYGGGGGGKIKETMEEKALAEVAEKKWSYYQENYRPIEDEYMKRVDAMDSEGSYDFVRGAAGSGATAAFQGAKDRMADDLESSGINPNSGKYKASMATVADKQGLSSADSQSRATIDQQDQYVQGLSNIAAMGRGQATEAQAGLSDVAGLAASKTANDAMNAWNEKAANVNAAGSVFGAAAHSYTNKSPGLSSAKITDPGAVSQNFNQDYSDVG